MGEEWLTPWKKQEKKVVHIGLKSYWKLRKKYLEGKIFHMYIFLLYLLLPVSQKFLIVFQIMTKLAIWPKILKNWSKFF